MSQQSAFSMNPSDDLLRSSQTVINTQPIPQA